MHGENKSLFGEFFQKETRDRNLSKPQSNPSRKKALFNSTNVTPGGTCLSSFVVVSNGDGILIGKMVKPEIWVERFFVGEKFAPVYTSSNKFILPSCHLAWFESPIDAALRVVTEQIQLKADKQSLKLLEVQSHVGGDPNDTVQPAHWDLCFVYELNVPPGTTLKSPGWFEELHFANKKSLKSPDFTRGHGDVLLASKIIES